MGSLGAALPGDDPSKSPGEVPSKSPEENSETEWPVLKDGDKVLPTEFREGSWKCPYCSHWTARIKQHLMTHCDKIQRWEDAERFCSEVSQRKRKVLEQKRSQNSKRKETKIKADKKRATDPKRKETLTKADEKRATDPKRRREDPKRKETLTKADEKREKDNRESV